MHIFLTIYGYWQDFFLTPDVIELGIKSVVGLDCDLVVQWTTKKLTWCVEIEGLSEIEEFKFLFLTDVKLDSNI